MRAPVLLLVFNRPHTTQQVFEAVRAARPTRLYIAADGARGDRDGEHELCEEVRAIATAVDWSCDIKTLFREHNLGCKLGVSSGIDWFFEHEEEGVILEDDIVPLPVFFDYMDHALNHYRYHSDVGAICGYNLLNRSASGKPFLADYVHIWGWGTWRRVWKLYNPNPNIHTQFFSDIAKALHIPVSIAKKLNKAFIEASSGVVDTWDAQFGYLIIAARLKSLYPPVNLVKNCGFGSDATHTKCADHSVPTGIWAQSDVAAEIREAEYWLEYESIRFAFELPSRLQSMKRKLFEILKGI